MKTLIRNAVCAESIGTLIYVKGYEKEKWLVEILENDAAIETIDADYEDIEFLRNLKPLRAFRCGYHAKNCALENVCKYDW
ncbi:interstitial collagenase [Lasius niger]|uniref:Interstitial collagenase n=1 Tax=Lasius niger TaxID=67767 RepID=A0A0J7JVJ4_LASNI|nr:interstitial collagenase [Lasius niger]